LSARHRQIEGGEISIHDGQRLLGQMIPRGDCFEAFDAEGDYLCKAETMAEGRAAIIRADRDRDAELQRLADDDGGLAA
jgi:hypothetical protein